MAQKIWEGPAVATRQGLNGQRFIALQTAVPADRIVDRLKVDRRNKVDAPQGYQRGIDMHQVENLAHYFEHGLGIVPPVLLNARDGVGVKFEKGILTIFASAQIYCVDGQHRKETLKCIAARGVLIGNIDLPIMLLTESRDIEDTLFGAQREAKPIHPDLHVANLQTKMEALGGPTILREHVGRTEAQKRQITHLAVAGVVVDRLNDDPTSLFAGIIWEDGDRRTEERYLPKKSMVQALIYFVLKHDQDLALHPDRTAQHLIDYLAAVATVWPVEFADVRRSTYALRGVVPTGAMLRLFPTVLHRVERGGAPTVKRMATLLTGIRDRLPKRFWRADGEQMVDFCGLQRGRKGSDNLASFLAAKLPQD